MHVRSVLMVVFVCATSVVAAAQRYVPAYERDSTYNIEGGTETLLIYFGGSFCGPCHDPEFKEALEQAKLMLVERAERKNEAFAAVGVALDLDVEEGLAFLRDAGRFDEFVVGRSWFNSASLSRLWRPERPAGQVPGLPSVLVVERDMTMGAWGISASAPRYLAELTGTDEVIEWVEAGAPLE